MSGFKPWFDEGDSHVKKLFLLRVTHVLKGVSAKGWEDLEVREASEKGGPRYDFKWLGRADW